MKKILAFGASNNTKSINKQFANFTANQISNATVTLIDLNDLEMPLFSIDKEKQTGIPEQAQQFYDLIGSHDALVISLAEYNQNYTTAFKNLIDWTSRIEKKLFQEKPMFLLSTAPGGRGGANVMSIALKFLPFIGANIISNFSLPLFRKNFSKEEGIIDAELKAAFKVQLEQFETQLFETSQVKRS